MKWSTDKPSRPGWYWWRDLSAGEPVIICIVAKNGSMFVYADEDFCPVWQYEGSWAGPLMPPED